jgi:hypothetical protein
LEAEASTAGGLLFVLEVMEEAKEDFLLTLESLALLWLRWRMLLPHLLLLSGILFSAASVLSSSLSN